MFFPTEDIGRESIAGVLTTKQPTRKSVDRFSFTVNISCDDELLRIQIKSYVTRELWNIFAVYLIQPPPHRASFSPAKARGRRALYGRNAEKEIAKRGSAAFLRVVDTPA